MKRYDPSTEVDFVVIGSGAAGGVMAKQLALGGFSVVVLEQGGSNGYGREQDFSKDELLVKYYPSDDTQVLTNPKTQPNTFRRTASEKATKGTHSYGCMIGGGTVTYGASSWRHLPWEFNEKTSFGGMAGTGVEDWPVSYDELEPYYTQAEWELGISGKRIDAPYFAPMSKEYPVPPLALKSSGAIATNVAKKMGLHVVPNVAAIITQPYNGRGACNNCGSCSNFGCQVKARSSSATALLPIAEATGRCEIRARSYVHEIVTDKSGKVTGVAYFDIENGNRNMFQKAKAVVLSANGTETPRLLLMSKSNRFKDGLANSSGIVGKYLMSGNGGGATALFDHPLNEFKGCVSGAAILDYVPNDVKARGFYGGGRMTARGFTNPIEYALGSIDHPDKWGAGWKKALAEQSNHRMIIANFVSTMPLETNTVDLDPDVKDAWGMPAMRITLKSHDNDMMAAKWFAEKAAEILHAAGAKSVYDVNYADARGGAHSRGTCRMGNDPKTSVVNKYHRAHDVPNLFIVDGSSFVTGGRNHPTMTISALAYRAADHLVAAAKSGNIKI